MTHANPQHQLPDFKPKGVSTIDRVLMWLLTFMIVLFGMFEVVYHYNIHHTETKPTTTISKSVSPSPSASPTKKHKKP